MPPESTPMNCSPLIVKTPMPKPLTLQYTNPYVPSITVRLPIAFPLLFRLVLTARASRSLHLSQSGYRPDGYREPSRFEPGGPAFLGGGSRVLVSPRVHSVRTGFGGAAAAL